MDFDAFKKLALTTLLGRQQENGSWLNDLVTTISAVEALCEECGGPDPVCKFSGLYEKLHGHGHGDWLFPFSWGLHTNPDDPNAAYVAAVYHAVSFGGSELRHLLTSQANAWMLSKWARMNVLTDADCQLPIWHEDLEHLEQSIRSHHPQESWLLAYIGQAKLHRNFYFELNGGLQNAKHRPDIIRLASELLALVKTDHWEGQAITPEEATAITGAFLFHECTMYLYNLTNSSIELAPVRDKILAWLLHKQLVSGGWSNSPHVTAHCLKLMDAALVGLQPQDPHMSLYIAALRKGVRHLLEPKVQTKWIALGTYQQIDILTVLLRLSKRPSLNELVFKGNDIDGSALAPDVFISYGGPDRDFAKILAKDLEAAGIRVWFAEWDLDYGDDVVEEIEKGLTSTRKFVILLTPEGIQRPWVRKELSAAFQQALSGPGKLILPVMYRQCHPPPFLAAHRWIDFTKHERYPEQRHELVRRLKGQKPSRM